MHKPSIFIASSVSGTQFAKVLCDQLKQDAKVSLWTDLTFHLNKTPLESLKEIADEADLAVIIISPDDQTITRNSVLSPNIIFELGFLVGRLGSDRTLVVVNEEQFLRIPSDLSGMTVFRLNLPDAKNLPIIFKPVSERIRKTISDLGIRKDRAIEFYSCFISYANTDHKFALKLYDDLRKVGVRCWLDVKNLKIGDSWVNQIDRAIRLHDKVLLVLSNNSINSSWVKHEIKNALEIEQSKKKELLFPIRLDNSIFASRDNAALDLIQEKHIGDFSNWEEEKFYQKAFSRLIRDLTISTSKGLGGSD